MADLTPEQAEVLLHTLGLTEPGARSTRNLFVTGWRMYEVPRG